MTRKIKNLIKDFSISSFNYSGGMGGGEAGVPDDLLTNKGDTHGYTTENARVPIGSDTQVLTADSTEALGLKWATPTDIAPPTTTKGDLSGFSTLQTRIPIGADSTVLTADSTQALGLAWAAAGGGIEYNEMTSATTFTPTQQTGLAKVTVDTSYLTVGDVDIKVDGVTVESLNLSEFYNKILNPATSLSFVSNNATWQISAGVFDTSTSIAQNNTPNAIALSTDGTKMYMVGSYSGTDRVYQYTLSTAWDLSTTTYDSVWFSVSAQDGTPTDVKFSDDGTKMYILGRNNDTIYQYTLSTAWDLSTASYASIALGITGYDNDPEGIAFSSDGTKLYMVGRQNDKVYEWNLSTPWVINTAGYVAGFLVSGQDANPKSVAISTDGSYMFMVGNGNRVYRYTMSTPWSIATSTYDSMSLYLGGAYSSYWSISFKPDGTKLYASAYTGRVATQWSVTENFTGNARISVG
jgi:hypothetical protein